MFWTHSAVHNEALTFKLFRVEPLERVDSFDVLVRHSCVEIPVSWISASSCLSLFNKIGYFRVQDRHVDMSIRSSYEIPDCFWSRHHLDFSYSCWDFLCFLRRSFSFEWGRCSRNETVVISGFVFIFGPNTRLEIF